MWANGANFESVVNQDMGDMFPYGMDPTLRNDDPEPNLVNSARHSTRLCRRS